VCSSDLQQNNEDNSISINEISLEEARSTEQITESNKTTESNKPEELSRLVWVGIYIARTFLWIILFVFAVIPSGFGVGEALIAAERDTYKYPGQLYYVPSSEEDHHIRFRMHLYCTGTMSKTKPTILIEAQFGESGYLYEGLQSNLKENWRTCIYDRPGYGWSDVSPMGSASPKTNAFRLNYLLNSAGEFSSSSTGKVILVGHKEGGEMMQIFAYLYQSRVAGLALLDSYMNIDRLLGTSNKDVAAATKLQCDNWNIGRALESVAIMRIVNEIENKKLEKAGKSFVGSNRKQFYSTQNNGNYYPSHYSDLCFHDAATQFTDYLTSVGTQNSGENVQWPQIASNIPVYIVSSSNSLSGEYGNEYTTQLTLLLNTLSSNNKISSAICSNCYDSFPYDSDEHISWLANKLDNYFKITYP
jgi:pimeloyl-ACP methyl ester carboxylesterase